MSDPVVIVAQPRAGMASPPRWRFIVQGCPHAQHLDLASAERCAAELIAKRRAA